MGESRSEALLRHDLVWIDRLASASAVLAAPTEDAYRIARGWIGSGCPVVVSRQPSRCDGARRLAVGLALPIALDKRRFALEIDPRAITHRRLPALLSSLAARLESPWRAPLRALCEAAKEIDIEYRVFGSAAWQFWTRLGYLARDSDLDLLWRPSSEAQLAKGVALLDAWERDSGIRSDGEILFGEEAVCWREWTQSARSPRVLVKSREGVSLRSRRELTDRLARSSGCAPETVRGLEACA
jgi:phosphoribosyl-dephospho-CoA transferase